MKETELETLNKDLEKAKKRLTNLRRAFLGSSAWADIPTAKKQIEELKNKYKNLLRRFDMTKKEKALKETDDKLNKKKAELWDFLLETKFSTRLSIQKEKGLEQSIKELEEQKKQLEGGKA